MGQLLQTHIGWHPPQGLIYKELLGMVAPGSAPRLPQYIVIRILKFKYKVKVIQVQGVIEKICGHSRSSTVFTELQVKDSFMEWLKNEKI
jgi:hypothetical protein